MVIVIDPGHGGSDPGATGPGGQKEKDVNLAVARHAANYLLSCGVKAILTRNKDAEMSLSDRCAVANLANAACFISVHANAAANSEARGAETWYHHNSTKGQQLATCLQRQIASLGLVDRGVKDDYYLNRPEGGSAGLYVLRNTAMPAALVEVAFISNPDEEKWLADPDNQDAAGKAIAKGICEYLGVPFVEEKPIPKSLPKELFPAGSSSGNSGGSGADWSWAVEKVNKLAEKARLNAPHDPGEPVTVGLLAVILDRLGLL